jgi:hypothetical protein
MRTTSAERGQLRACSGCAGDYEDPERTTWSAVRDDDSADEANAEHAKDPGPRERFPVPEE